VQPSNEPAPGGAPARKAQGGVLDPVERSSEVLFGLIMALTFTSSIRAAEGGHEEVRTLLFAALACNVAWGIVDAVMYLMARLAERGAAWRAGRAFREAKSPADARVVVAGVLPPSVASAVGGGELEALRSALERAKFEPARPRLTRRDLRGALGVFLLVTLTTFPVAVPFLFVRDAERALRISNAVALAMLFAVGCAFGRAAGIRAWAAGLAMIVLGGVLVAITIALGG